jgi:CubicO group peptidase (beta-lactamase class C family)
MNCQRRMVNQMKYLMKISIRLILILIFILFIYGDYYLWQRVSLGVGVRAKTLCSGVFISNREPNAVMNEDPQKFVNFIHMEVDLNNMHSVATGFGFVTRRAIFREGLGATILNDSTEVQLRNQYVSQPKIKTIRARELEWPTGEKVSQDKIPENFDKEKLHAAIDYAFTETSIPPTRRTRAVVVVHKKQIIAERYARGFNKDTPLLGYDLTGSVINALTGIRIEQGKLSLDEAAPVPEWKESEDPRSAITLDNLLRMSSGLEEETLADIKFMLYGSGNTAAYSAKRKLMFAPGEKWSYSFGSTNIVSRIIKDTFSGDLRAYFDFPRQALFQKIGATSAIIEPDESGTFIGSTFMYATARDWSRLGLLYLQDGVWEGERVLPEGWIKYSITPSQSNRLGNYGSHFWINGISKVDGTRKWPSLPSDAFFALGQKGQSITIIPSRDLVVVRLGMTQKPNAWNLELFISQILDAIN